MEKKFRVYIRNVIKSKIVQKDIHAFKGLGIEKLTPFALRNLGGLVFPNS